MLGGYDSCMIRPCGAIEASERLVTATVATAAQ